LSCARRGLSLSRSLRYRLGYPNRTFIRAPPPPWSSCAYQHFRNAFLEASGTKCKARAGAFEFSRPNFGGARFARREGEQRVQAKRFLFFIPRRRHRYTVPLALHSTTHTMQVI
jgi:hypothetical protein